MADFDSWLFIIAVFIAGLAIGVVIGGRFATWFYKRSLGADFMFIIRKKRDE